MPGGIMPPMGQPGNPGMPSGYAVPPTGENSGYCSPANRMVGNC
jgi:hypothetical protein